MTGQFLLDRCWGGGGALGVVGMGKIVGGRLAREWVDRRGPVRLGSGGCQG